MPRTILKGRSCKEWRIQYAFNKYEFLSSTVWVCVVLALFYRLNPESHAHLTKTTPLTWHSSIFEQMCVLLIHSQHLWESLLPYSFIAISPFSSAVILEINNTKQTEIIFKLFNSDCLLTDCVDSGDRLLSRLTLTMARLQLCLWNK